VRGPAPLIDLREAARLAHVSRSKVWRWVVMGALASSRPRRAGRKWYLSRARFMAWLD